MRLADLSRRQRLILGLAALFAALGALGTGFAPKPQLDRKALARLAAQAAEGPETTGTIQ
jgi:hypothetical protein